MKTPKPAKPKRVPARKPETSPDRLWLNKILCGVLWLLFALIWLCFALSLASFDPRDPAWSHSTAAGVSVHNRFGRTGAYTADIAYLIGGFSIIWWLAAAAFWLWQNFRTLNGKIGRRYYRFPGVVGVALTFVASAILEHALWAGDLPALPGDAGGMVGTALFAPMSALFGLPGTAIIALLSLLIGWSLWFQVSWLTVIENIGLWTESLWRFIVQKPRKIAAVPRRRLMRRRNAGGDELGKPGRAKVKVHVPASTPVQSELPFDDPAPDREDAEENAVLPPLDLLSRSESAGVDVRAEVLQETAERIEAKLREFKIGVKVVSVTAGPVVTRYEIEPDRGVKGSQIVRLSKDLARALSLESLRVVETVSGRNTMGIELPNEERQTVYLGEILRAPVWQNSSSPLTLALGKDVAGNAVSADLIKMPHVLAAGATGSGKSVCINGILLSLLYKSTPKDLRLILVDPKITELSIYEGIPHLLCPVLTDMKKVSRALDWCINEMERRNRLMGELSVRNLAGFNEKITRSPYPVPNPFSLTPDSPEALQTMPRIVVVIDEMADLMMTFGKQVEQQIARLAQKARAAGIHLVLATQRPSVDVITGLIKANIPTRIAFLVSSKIDSRTILDQTGAEQLLGNGDMLFLPPGKGLPTRLHGAFVSDAEVSEVVSYLKRHAPPQYIDALSGDDDAAAAPAQNDKPRDEMFDRAAAFVLESRKTSISALQRHLRIGYNRAANLIEEMERAGILSAPEVGGGARNILVPARNDD